MPWNGFRATNVYNYLPCFEGNHGKNVQTHSKNTGFRGFCGKNTITVRDAVWTVFLGVVVVAIWNSLAWEAPTGETSEKSTPWKDPREGKPWPWTTRALTWNPGSYGKTRSRPCCGPAVFASSQEYVFIKPTTLTRILFFIRKRSTHFRWYLQDFEAMKS